jgi:hypothetical protein
MKKQKLITSDHQQTFHTNVNTFLEEGWTVVPGTLVCSKAICNRAPDGYSKGHCFTTITEAWAVIIEKMV